MAQLRELRCFYGAIKQREEWLSFKRRGYSNLANAASLLWHAFKSLESPSNEVNWAGKIPLLRCSAVFSASRLRHTIEGFYTIDTLKKDQLVLGPFQGKVACQTIAIGRGVCGTAAKKQQTVMVDDVEAFPGHIACDSESRSEIVVPVVAAVANGTGGGFETKLVAIIDIDCAALNGFDKVDQTYLERLAALIASSCDWP